MKSTFQIVTTTGTTYTQGVTYNLFTDLGKDKATLQSYAHEAEFAVLQFTGDLKLEIHESRIEHIARLVK